MANDRIYIVCRQCGSQKMLAKYYPGGPMGVWFPEAVEHWVDKHMRCSPASVNFCPTLNGDRCFNLIAESDPEYEDYTPTGMDSS